MLIWPCPYGFAISTSTRLREPAATDSPPIEKSFRFGTRTLRNGELPTRPLSKNTGPSRIHQHPGQRGAAQQHSEAHLGSIHQAQFNLTLNRPKTHPRTHKEPRRTVSGARSHVSRAHHLRFDVPAPTGLGHEIVRVSHLAGRTLVSGVNQVVPAGRTLVSGANQVVPEGPSVVRNTGRNTMVPPRQSRATSQRSTSMSVPGRSTSSRDMDLPDVGLSKRQKLMGMVLTDDVHVRMKTNVLLTKLGNQKKALARFQLYWSAVALVMMVVQVELRLRSEEGESRVGLDVLRSLIVCSTAVSLVLHARYQHAHQRLAVLALSKPTRVSQFLFPVLEVLILLVGVIPPFVETSIANPRLPAQYGRAYKTSVYEDLYPTEETQNPTTHVDSLGVLMLLRFLLLFKWLIVGFGHLSSVELLSWKYRYPISPFFVARASRRTRHITRSPALPHFCRLTAPRLSRPAALPPRRTAAPPHRR